jgi:16S rRNA (cytidine1402-2'-O)-methyltransferase
MLYLIPTPIGNLADWTFRAVETVKSCDYLLCEDTRKTSILLQHYSIKLPLYSFHSFNEKQKEGMIVEDLRLGKTVGLVSDAGTPLICDPGASLLKALKEENLPYCALPGPCAFITALSQVPSFHEKMQFIGFLQEKSKIRKGQIIDMSTYEGVSGFYLSPHDFLSGVKEIEQIDPASTLYVFRELTKLFEEHIVGSPSEILTHFSQKPPRGEFVVFMKGTLTKASLLFTVEEIFRILKDDYQMKPTEAAKLTAQLTGASKKQLYKEHSC